MTSYAPGTPASQIRTPQQDVEMSKKLREMKLSGTGPLSGTSPMGATVPAAATSVTTPPTQSFLNSLLGAGTSGGGRPGVVQPGPRPGMGRPGMGRPGMGKPGTGGVNVGVRPPPVLGPGGVGISGTVKTGGSGAAKTGGIRRSMSPMAAQQIMPEGRAFKKGGMVGCDWKAPSSKTMRGAARKGKGK